MENLIKDTKIREYSEGMRVGFSSYAGRTTIIAYNQGGHDCTQVDLQDLLKFIKKDNPELLKNL